MALAGRLPALFLGMVVAVAALANGASRLAQDALPGLATQFNPFNVDATLAGAAAAVASTDGAVRDPARDRLVSALAFSPMDARLHSMVGIADETAGDGDSARRRFDAALRLEPSEIQALLHTIGGDVAAGDIASAALKIDRIARRWPGQWSLFEPHFGVLLGSEAGLTAFAEAFRSSPDGQARLVDSLIDKEETVDIAMPLLAQWKAIGAVVDPYLAGQTMRALLTHHKGAAAYSLFLQTLTEAERAEGGYVHNGRFALPLGGTPFNWTAREQAGVAIERGAADGRHHLQAEFSGNPLQLNNIVQTLRLPPGDYVLSVGFSTDQLTTPKPILAVVECADTRKRLATAALPQGSIADGFIEAAFAVPLLDCDMALIRFTTDFVALSFQNRFTGAFRLTDVRIRRDEG